MNTLPELEDLATMDAEQLRGVLEDIRRRAQAIIESGEGAEKRALAFCIQLAPANIVLPSLQDVERQILAGRRLNKA